MSSSWELSLRPLRCISCTHSTHTPLPWPLANFLWHFFFFKLYLTWYLTYLNTWYCLRKGKVCNPVFHLNIHCVCSSSGGQIFYWSFVLLAHGSLKSRNVVFFVSLFRVWGQSRKAHLASLEEGCWNLVSGNLYSVWLTRCGWFKYYSVCMSRTLWLRRSVSAVVKM